MLRELDLTEKLDILMTLAAEDREGPPQSPKALPPRLRHIGEAGALRPLNIRVLKGRGGTMRLLRILMTNACALNCHPKSWFGSFWAPSGGGGVRGCSSRPEFPHGLRR